MLRVFSYNVMGTKQQFVGSPLRSFATKAKTIKGRATPAGTMQFIRSSQLPLYHQFNKCGLYINPVIHGAPRQVTGLNEDDITYLEALTRRAVGLNRSNCVMVYKHNDGADPWYSTNLHKLFDDPANKVSREQMVVVANLGLASTKEEVFRRLANACNITALEMVDIVIVEVGTNYGVCVSVVGDTNISLSARLMRR
jgi:hypothetical protein